MRCTSNRRENLTTSNTAVLLKLVQCVRFGHVIITSITMLNCSIGSYINMINLLIAYTTNTAIHWTCGVTLPLYVSGKQVNSIRFSSGRWHVCRSYGLNCTESCSWSWPILSDSMMSTYWLHKPECNPWCTIAESGCNCCWFHKSQVQQWSKQTYISLWFLQIHFCTNLAVFFTISSWHIKTFSLVIKYNTVGISVSTLNILHTCTK